MDVADLVPLGLVAVAAAFGYLATWTLRRHEVVRSVAVEIDEQLREAFNESLRDLDDTDLLNAVNEPLIQAEIRCETLPRRQHDRVKGQIAVAQYVLEHAFDAEDAYATPPQVHLQAAITGAREVVAPLLFPPPLIYRRPARPTRYPDPWSFAGILQRHGTPAAALDDALGSYLEGLPEAFEDHYPPSS